MWKTRIEPQGLSFEPTLTFPDLDWLALTSCSCSFPSALASTPALDFGAQTAYRKTNPESLPSFKEGPGQGAFPHAESMWDSSSFSPLAHFHSCCPGSFVLLFGPLPACSCSGSARELGKTALPCLSRTGASKSGSLAGQPNTEGPCGLDWNVFPQKRSQTGRCSGEGVGIPETVELSLAAFDSKDVLRRKGLLS